MFAQVYNISGVKHVVPNFGHIATHTSVQLFRDISPEQFTSRRGPSIGEALAALKAAGKIDYQFVMESSDYGAGRVGVKCLRVTHARGHFTDADTSQVLTDDVALPAGAVLLQAHLNVHTVVAGGAVSAAVVKSGHDSDDDAFDASENVFANATRRQLTTLAVGSDIGGKKLSLTLATTNGNVADLTAGDLELVVLYAVVPTL
jgi:hypothetical protein